MDTNERHFADLVPGEIFRYSLTSDEPGMAPAYAPERYRKLSDTEAQNLETGQVDKFDDPYLMCSPRAEPYIEEYNAAAKEPGASAVRMATRVTLPGGVVVDLDERMPKLEAVRVATLKAGPLEEPDKATLAEIQRDRIRRHLQARGARFEGTWRRHTDAVVAFRDQFKVEGNTLWINHYRDGTFTAEVEVHPRNNSETLHDVDRAFVTARDMVQY